MFSPQLNGSVASVRSSRRRPRPLSSEGSAAQPKAKRQRSALGEHTFVAPNGPPDMEEIKAIKVAMIARQESTKEVQHAPRQDIVVRGKKPKQGDRASKGDGSVVLTANDTYTVSKLPALPDRLRTDSSGRQHGAIYSNCGYALVLSHTHAIVWPYTANVPSPETFAFALPYPSKHASDPLPLGSLVSASASSQEPGLVVVMPMSGKVTYWESIASAATLDLIRQQRNGVEMTITGMLSAETVIQILNAETAGFVLSFSSGRLAYMSVRDGQGKPAISVQFLRGGGGTASGGIFGSLRNALSISSWRADIAAVRAGPPEKVGERNVVVASVKGKLQAWNMHRGGHNSLQAEAEGRESIVLAIKEAQPSFRDLLLDSFEVLDFTFTPKLVVDSQLSNQSSEKEDNEVHLLLLTSLNDGQTSHYSLVEVVLKQDGLIIRNVHTLNLYTTSVSQASTSKPRLYLPNPALVAFIIFDRAVVVTSVARQPESPELQLRNESHIQPKRFEDVIDFREDMNVEIVGSGAEEPHGPQHGIDDSKSRRHKAKYPAAVLIVRGGGVVRVAATDVSKLVSTKAPQVTAKSKLEQAVFFGTLEQNPLSFSGRPELQFTSEEVSAAALELSRDILKSETPYIPSVPASINQNLQKRSAALHDLADHLRMIGVSLDRVTKWKLLWDAEKMTAATRIWQTYDARVKERPEGQKRGLLSDLVEFIHEDYKTEPVPEAGELDRVRHWFIKDIWNLEIAVPWAYQVIKYTYQDGQKDHAFVAETISEADDIVLGALAGAFDFRMANKDLYGLQAEELEHGVLKAGYEGLPEFWTSTIYIIDNTRKQADLAGMLVKEYWQKPPGGVGQPSQAVVKKLRLENTNLIDLAIRSNTERIRWDSAQDSPGFQIEAEQIKTLQSKSQDEQIVVLGGEIGLPDEAIALAEKHSILPTLAKVIMLELIRSSGILRQTGLSKDEYEYHGQRIVLLQDRINQEFATFGTSWANALYEYYISTGSMNDLLNNDLTQQTFLTKFLRSKPEYAKVSWINEVTREKNYDLAAKTLLDLGLKRERDLWSKKIELSIGKLARLAGEKYSKKDGIIIPPGGQTELASAANQLSLIQIQEQIYGHILPSISAAIDEKAELQLALEAHGNKHLQPQRAFTSFLEEAMAHLINHEAMDSLALIDLLTLMGEDASHDQGSIRGQEFYLALEASRHGLYNKDERTSTQKVIWRRCLLRDNWTEINNTDLKDDQQVSEQLRTTALYSTLRACFKNRIFEGDSTIKPINPQAVLGAYTEELDHRFNGLDANIRESIMKDMQAEARALKPYIEKSRLEKWYQGALDLAKQDLAEEITENTVDGEKMFHVARRLREVEEKIAENERKTANTLLHSKLRFKPKRLEISARNFRGSPKVHGARSGVSI